VKRFVGDQPMTGLTGIRSRRGVTPVGPAKPNILERIIPGLNSIKRVELVLFSRMMATFIRAGIPILDGHRGRPRAGRLKSCSARPSTT
jgi:hypothetical protein